MRPKQTMWVCAAVLALFLPAAQLPAQVQGTGPIEPIRQLPIPGARDTALEPSPPDSSGQRAQGDTHTLSSIEMLGTGSLGVVRNFLDPSFRFNQSVDTGIIPGTKNSVTSMGINLAFNQSGSRSQLTGSYDGAHALYYPSSFYNNTYHNLAVSDEIHWARWILRWRDDLVISPEASFGGLDTGGTSGQIAQQSSAGASDTILTQRAKRLNDTAAGEVDYFLSRRSIMTFAGSYMTLHFTNSGFINSHGLNGRIGYDHALDPKDSVGLMYTYNRTDFSAAAPLLQTDAGQFAYGRRVTGRLAFQISAGPQIVRYGLTRTLNWTLTSATTYQTPRTQYSFSYTHGTFAGSGVFAGSQNHILAGNVNHALTRLWSASLGGGYAFNQALTSIQGVNNIFGNWYGTASLAQEIGRHLQFSVSYRYQQQAAGSGACPISACDFAASRQVLNVSIAWHPWSMAR